MLSFALHPKLPETPPVRNALLVLIMALLVLQASFILYRNSRPPAPPAQVVKKADEVKIDRSRAMKRSPDEIGEETIRGFVYNYDGTPAAQCTVLIAAVPEDADRVYTAQRMARWFEQSDTDGRFRIETLPPGDYTVLARTDRTHAVESVRLREGGAAADLMLWLRHSQTIRGTVVDAAQQPVADARVFPLAQDPTGLRSPFTALPAASGADGGFMFTYLPPGPWRFLVVRGDASAHAIVDYANGGAHLRIEMGDQLPVQGELTSREDGEPIARVKLQIEERQTGLVRYTATTDDAGRFDFGPVYNAPYGIQIQSNRYALPEGTQHFRPDELLEMGQLSLAADRAARIRGRILDETGRAGVRDVPVLARSLSASGHLVVTSTDLAGYYNLQGLAPQRYLVKPQGRAHYTLRDGDTRIRATADGAVDGPTWVRALRPSVHGRVLDTQGQPVAGASVRAARLHGAGTPGAQHELDWAWTARSDADGAFSLNDLADDVPLLFHADKMDQRSRPFGPEQLTAEGLEGLTLTLDRPAGSAVAGQVVDTAGAPVPFAYVACYTGDRELPPLQAVQADYAGAFRITRLPAGPYRLIASAKPGEADPTLQLRIDLNAHEFIRDIQLRLP